MVFGRPKLADMVNRRNVLRLSGLAATATLGGLGATAAADRDGGGHGHSHGSSGAAESHVEYVRNVEEVRGHLTSSMELKRRERGEDAELHAGHGSDYFAAVLPPVRDADPELASRLRGRLRAVQDHVRSDDPAAYESFVTDDVFPLLEDAVTAVVPAEERDSTAFRARVLNALVGRIADEYSAAITADGDVDLMGEYWDARGFLSRVETRHAATDSDLGSTAANALDTLRSGIEAVDPPADVIPTTVRYRVGTSAAAGLESASVDGIEDAVAYARAAGEVRGHAYASRKLSEYGDGDAASLHAGHGPDYAMALLPAVQAEAPDLAATLQERMFALSDRVGSASPGEYEQFVTEELFPPLAEAESLVLPDELAGTTSFDARVTIALLGRIEEEYAKAVTDEEVIELYGEYWDARGFYHRVTRRYDAMKSDLDRETREAVEPELELLGEELRTAVPPRDVANSIEPLTDDLGRAVDE